MDILTEHWEWLIYLAIVAYPSYFVGGLLFKALFGILRENYRSWRNLPPDRYCFPSCDDNPLCAQGGCMTAGVAPREETILEQLKREGYCDVTCPDNPRCGNGGCANLPDKGPRWNPSVRDKDVYFSPDHGYITGLEVNRLRLEPNEECWLHRTEEQIEAERLANNPIARAVHNARGGNSPPTERTEWS